MITIIKGIWWGLFTVFWLIFSTFGIEGLITLSEEDSYNTANRFLPMLFAFWSLGTITFILVQYYFKRDFPNIVRMKINIA